jgi:peptidoglycan hydrolase-like protein with peptidoglycan-binding domain
MAHSARQRESRRRERGTAGILLGGLAAAFAGNPVLIGGGTAFLVAFSFISANALWYQPHPHPNAIFATRAVVGGEPAPAPEEAPVPVMSAPRNEPRIAAHTSPDRLPASPPVMSPEAAAVQAVQEALARLGFYQGQLDGLMGPMTREAIVRYRRQTGLEGGEEIDAALLRQLDVSAEAEADGPELETASVPLPQPRQASIREAETLMPAPAAPDPLIVKIQAGLRAFGHDGIVLDGVAGARTRAAIEEFQSLFGLPVTGEPDAALLAKMQEIGLTD